MPISNYKVSQSMRMNVASQLLLQELALKANCKYNPDKDDIKELSRVSMQCLSNSIVQKDINVDSIQETIKKTADKQQLQKFIFENSNHSKIGELSKIRNFIPYPDHNYGQQPPLTPPLEVSQQSELNPKKVLNQVIKVEGLSTQVEDEQGVTKCICGFSHDDGYMICCDDCGSWQHIDCMGIQSSKVPEKYSCHKCSPRILDLERARAIQAKKKENMSEGDDEEEEETASEDEASKTMYTAISNTPTRITLLSNINNTTNQQSNGKIRSKKGSRMQKKKLSDQRNTRSRKTKKKDKLDEVSDINDDAVPFLDDDSIANNFPSSQSLYEEIESNKYDEEIQIMQLKIPEVSLAIDLNNIVKSHTVCAVTANRTGLLASCHISTGNIILEYKGHYLSRQKFDELNPVLSESCPYVTSYSKLSPLEIIIDARAVGNDARFIRKSCTPNAELKHFILNGELRIMVISKFDIEKDSEITIPFNIPVDTYTGYLECACKLESCIVKLHNDEWSKSNDAHRESFSVVDSNNENSMSKYENEGQVESEKLSREERKIQALLKQFEKLEKRQDTGKKVKEVKTPTSRSTSADENVNPLNNIHVLQKPPLTRKPSGSKRKASMGVRRRTRQSSCSSEPVSPNELEISSVVSTPTTPLSTSNPVSLFDIKNYNNGKKEPLTLTLPIQRKSKQDQLTASPTPPGTPFQQSPVQNYTENSLSLDTQSLLDSTPMKGGTSYGLLQIAPSTPLSISMNSSSGFVTAEEKIGDVTMRFRTNQPSSSCYPNSLLHAQEAVPARKYYGCMKKHWLEKYAKNHPNNLNGPKNGFEQISLAALVASLSHRQYVQNVTRAVTPSPIFKRPKSCVPLKKQYLQRAVAVLDKTEKTSILNEPLMVDTSISDVEASHTHVKCNDGVVTVNKPTPDNLLIKPVSNCVDISDVKQSQQNRNCSESVHKNHLLLQNTQNRLQYLPSQQSSRTDLDVVRTMSNQAEIISNTNSSIKRSRPVINIAEQPMKKPRNDEVVSDNSNSDDSVGLKTGTAQSLPVTINNVHSPVKSTSILYPTGKVVYANTDFDRRSLTPPRKSISASPRSSVDSNPDSETAGALSGEHGNAGKKKLSFKEYRNRQRNQKAHNIPTSSQQHHMTVDSSVGLSKPPMTINEATDSLLTPRTLSLCELSMHTVTPEKIKTEDTPKLFDDESCTSAAKSDSNKGISLEQNGRLSVGSTNSVFEPVSPGNEFDSGSPHNDEAGSLNQSINSGTTKHSFSMQNSITKTPFGKKQNPPAPGLLQFLSAQKYPHLTNIGSNQHAVPSTNSSSNSQIQHQYTTSSGNSFKTTDYPENDDDASSTHSNISSTSYGSTSDVTHERSTYSNHHRSYSRGEYGTRDNYYLSQPHSNYGSHQYYQHFNVHMHHPQSSGNAPRSSNGTRNSGYAGYQQQSSHSSRHRPSSNSRGYQSYQ